jgi:hypothetical protein
MKPPAKATPMRAPKVPIHPEQQETNLVEKPQANKLHQNDEIITVRVM